MEIFRLFGTISINKAAAMADISAVNAHAAKSSGAIGKAFTAIGKAAKVAFTVAAAAGAVMFVKAIKSAAEFEQAMAMVKAVTGATAEEFAALTEKSKQLGRDTKFSMIEIADGMTALGRAGFSANEIISAMDGVTALAASQMIDLGTASEITSNLIRGFGLEASEAERVANVLAATASSSNTTVQSLGESFKYIAPVAKQYGVSIEETASAIGILGNNGIQGTMATRSLSTALIGLAAPTEDAQDTMDALGISMFDANGEFIGLNAAVGELERGFIGLTAQEKAAALSSIVGAEALKHFSILVDEGEDALNDYTGELTGTTAAFDQMAIQLDTLEGQWTIMKGSVSLLFQTLGESLMPVLKNLLRDHIIPLINRTQEWVQAMGGIRGMVAHGLMALAEWLRGVAEWIRAHEYLEATLDSLKKVFEGVLSFVGNVFRGDWSAAWEDIKGIASAAVGVITNVVSMIWDALPISEETKEKVIAAWEGFVESIKGAVSAILAEFGVLGDNAGSLLDGVVSLFADILRAVSSVINFLIEHSEGTKAALAVIAAGFIAIKAVGIASVLTGIATGATAATGAMGVLAALLSPAGLLIAGLSLLGFGFAEVNSRMAEYTTKVDATVEKTKDLEGAFDGLTNSEEDLETAGDVLNMAINRVGSALNELVENGSLSIITLSDISGKMDELNQEVSSLPVEEMASAWRTGVEAILQEYEAIVPGISDILDDVVGEAEAAGGESAQGYSDGLASGQAITNQAVYDYVDGVKNAFAERLEIESPSKVTYGYGEDTGQGFADGLDSTADKLDEAALRILGQMEAEAQVAAADAGTTTGETYTEETADAISDGAGDVADAAGEVTAALTKELSELLKALTEAEHGSYEYAKALKDLQDFHEDLVKAAEYLESQNIEVADSLKTLISQTAAYADRQEEVNEVVDKAISKMGDLRKSFSDYVQIMAQSEKGTVAYAEGLKGVQSLSDSLIDTVDFLEAHNITASEAIWDMISALEAQGAETKKTAREVEKLAEETEAAEKETERLEKAQKDAEKAAEDHKNEIKKLGHEFVNLAKNAIRDVVNAYKSMREEAEEYAKTVAEINEDFRRNELEADERLSQDTEDEALRHKRELEDIERDHQRRVEEIRAKEYEDQQDMLDKLAAEEIDYLQDLEDEKIRHTRALEDLDEDYTRETKENAEDRIAAIDEEGAAYEENRTRIGDVLMGIGKDIVTYLGDKAITSLIDSLAESMAGVGTAAETAAATAGTAMTNLAGSVSSAAPGLISTLGQIAMAFVPIMIGTSDKVADAVANVNKWITENILGQQYGSGITMTDSEGNRFRKDDEGNWVPFAKGGIFNRPTLLPAHTVAEAGVSEAYIPLSKGVLGQIGEGIVNAITPQSPVLAGAGGINIDMRGMYDGAQITVRNDSDIEALARANYDLFSSRLRAEGRRI